MKSGNHGSGIAEALQLIAPEAQLILIDINKRSKKLSSLMTRMQV